jgi:hypothetical protein
MGAGPTPRAGEGSGSGGHMSPQDYPFEETGVRPAPDREEAAVFSTAALTEGGVRSVPSQARRFQKQAAAELSEHPMPEKLPRWVLALVQKKVQADELAKTVAERTMRAPSKENQTLALMLANEIARMDGGPEAIQRHFTPELLDRVSGRGERER